MSLYDSEASMVVDAWAAIKPYLNKKDRDDAAQAFLRTLENYVDIESMANDIAGHDGPLDRALSTLYGGYSDDEDNYNDPEGDEDLFSGEYDDDEE